MKNNNGLPSLQELEALRRRYLDELAGAIENAAFLAAERGEEVQYNANRTSRKWTGPGLVTVELFTSSAGFDTVSRRYLENRTVIVKVGSKTYCEHRRNGRGDIDEDSYVVPGSWTDVVRENHAGVVAEIERAEDERDQRRRRQLARQLQLDYQYA